VAPAGLRGRACVVWARVDWPDGGVEVSMGTRADFWIDDGTRMEWLGSVAYDGYEWAEKPDCALMRADDEHSFRRAVKAALEGRRCGAVVMPEDGWVWPWPDSTTTDRAYVLRNDLVEHYCFGRLAIGVDEDGSLQTEDAKDSRFPAMVRGERQPDTP
jgi:hypothetical protein